MQVAAVEDITDLFPGLREEDKPAYFVERVEIMPSGQSDRVTAAYVLDKARFNETRVALKETVTRLQINPADETARAQALTLFRRYEGLISHYDTFIMPTGAYQPRKVYDSISKDDLDLIAAMGHAAS